MHQIWTFQHTAIEKGLRNNLLIADACGLGKTLMAIEIGKSMYREGHCGVRLVICEKVARLQWEDFIHFQAPGEYTYMAKSMKDWPEDVVQDDFLWIIIHHEAFRKLSRKHPAARLWFDLIIVDEAHKIKNRKAQQTVGIKLLSAYRKICMTATPIERTPSDLFAPLQFLNPERYRGYHGFRAKYVKTEKNWAGYDVDVGAKNLPQLKHELKDIFIKRTRDEVSEYMPPMTERWVPVEMIPPQSRLYKHIRRESNKDIVIGMDEWEQDDMVIPNTLAQITRLHQVVTWPGNIDIAEGSGKLQWVDHFIESNPETSILVFTKYRATAKLIASTYQCPHIIGGSKDRIKDGDSLVVGTIKAMKSSLDFPWMDTTIFVDQDWSTIDMYQAKERIDRAGSTNPKTVYYLYTPSTVDNLVRRALIRKWTESQLVYTYLKET